MGLPFSIMGKLGLHRVNSLATNKVYDKYFSKKDIRNFNEFHVAFIDLCKDFSSIMPGKHYYLPQYKEIQTLHSNLQNQEDEGKRREVIIEFMKREVGSRTVVDDSVTITTGLVAPSAAILLKKTSQITPLKSFKLHLIPNIVFLPTCTLIALVGVRVLHINKAQAMNIENLLKQLN